MKIILLFTALTILLIPSLACNQSNWELSNGTLTIRNDAGMREWKFFLNSTGGDWDPILNSIKVVKLNYGVTIIANSAFEWCKNLEEVFMANSIHTIDKAAFAMCPSLKTIHWSRGLQIIDENAFRESGLCEARLPNKVQQIRKTAFYDCPNLKRIILPAYVTEFEGIMDCYNLREVVFLGKPPGSETGSHRNVFWIYAEEQRPVTIYYLKRYKEYWSPNGETEYSNMPLVAVDSLDNLPPLC